MSAAIPGVLAYSNPQESLRSSWGLLMYEHFEHTADLGLRVRAAELDTLFDEAAQALFSMVVEDLATVQPTQCIDVALQGDDPELLLFDWLRELLYHFDA